MKNERFAAMNIVNQLFDLAETSVEKRQAINDRADVFVQSIISNLLARAPQEGAVNPLAEKLQEISASMVIYEGVIREAMLVLEKSGINKAARP